MCRRPDNPGVEPPRSCWTVTGARRRVSRVLCACGVAVLGLGLAGWAGVGTGFGVAQPADEAEAGAGDGELVTVPPPPEEARVVIRGGGSVIGLLVERKSTGVRLRVDGRELFIPAGDISIFELLPPVEQRYEERRATIRDEDTETRLLLARWLRDRERYALALIEAEGVLGVDPGNAGARDLVRWLRAQLVLENRTRLRATGTGETGDGSPAGAEEPEEDEDKPFPRLTEAEINLIRVYEVDLSDPPKMVITRQTIDRLIEGYREHPLIPKDEEGKRALYSARPARILDLMFRVQARELYGDVKVLEDPAVFETFRERIHGRWLVNACASSGCHGGQEAGRLMLATRGKNRASTVYTNFYILDRYRLEDGRGLIDYEHPEKSVLLQAGLPEGAAQWKHPEVPETRGRRGWRPIFRSMDDDRYEEAVAWIESLYTPRPVYPVDYELPVPKSEQDADEPVER